MKLRLDHFHFRKGLLALSLVAASGKIFAEQNHSAAPKPPVVHKIQVTSPVEYFRELLAMSHQERERALASEPAEKRTVLASKIAEYEAMSLEERELRLRMTQMRWYLVPLMKSSPGDRSKLWERIPEEDRPLIEKRLRIWDQMPVQVQRDFLENEVHLGYLLKWSESTTEQRKKMMEQFPPHRKERMERELSRWNALPEERRAEMTAQFTLFFDLDEREKSRILSKVSAPNREQMEKTLKSLEHLPAEERKQYIEAFNRFAQMTPEERAQFLKNAERWQSMSAAEQQAWHSLVQRSQPPPPPPPLPPGVRRSAAPPPPSPPPLPVIRTNTAD